MQVPREKGERTPRQSANNNSSSTSNGNSATARSITAAPPQPSATPPAPMASNGVPAAAAAAASSWDRGYTPNASWSTAGPSPVGSEENQWNNGGYPAVETYVDSSFTFQQGGGFHPPAPVAVDPSTFVNGGGANGYRPRPSPQPQQIQIGGFSPHLSSPHPSPGSGQQMQNGRCGSVPPHFDSTNGYSPRPPSSNPPESAYRNGDTSVVVTGHQNGPPGYPSPVPQQQQTSWQDQQSSRGDGEPPNKRATPHEELNNRLKEKILNKQQQQQQQYGQQNGGNNGQYYVNYNNAPYGDEYSNGDGHFNPPSASSPAAGSNVRLDVHVEQQQQNGQQGGNTSPAHFLGQAHPQSGGTGGGANQPGMTLTTDSNGVMESPEAMSTTTSPPRNDSHTATCPTHNSASASSEEERLNKLRNNVKDEVPPCQCFPPDQCKSPVR